MFESRRSNLRRLLHLISRLKSLIDYYVLLRQIILNLFMKRSNLRILKHERLNNKLFFQSKTEGFDKLEVSIS